MTRVRSIAFPLVVFAALAPRAHAQSTPPNEGGFWDRWFERSDKSKAEQPHWLTPLAMTTPRLEQEFRYDVNWSQARPGAPYTENFGNTKGLELIPFENVEIIAGIPGYVVHNNPATPNGWGDFQLLVKYRILSSNEQHDNYILTAFLSETFPTATNKNGQLKSVVTPTIAYGKGWGDFDMQGTIGAAEPLALTSTIGRTYTWNHSLQLHVLSKAWPEVEINQTWFSGGKNDGKEQTFITPGVVVGRMRLTDRVGLTMGAGVQIAVSQFHTNNHNIILSARFPF
jgi:hypothetical protein